MQRAEHMHVVVAESRTWKDLFYSFRDCKDAATKNDLNICLASWRNISSFAARKKFNTEKILIARMHKEVKSKPEMGFFGAFIVGLHFLVT